MGFAQIIGNGEISFQLDALAMNGRLPHAVVFESEDGRIARAAAKELASAFLCTGDVKPCGVCKACRKVKDDIHPDVYTASTGGKQAVGIGEIREVISDCYIKPNEGRGKVYFIFDKMTPEAQNSLLKILEEPPQNVQFVIVTEKSTLLLKTVLSRCALFKLSSDESDSVSDEAFSTAVDIVRAAVLNVELPLIAVTSGLTKNRVLMKEVLDQLGVFFLQALEVKYLGAEGCPDYITDLSRMLTKVSLVKMTEVVSKGQEMLSHNCNMNVLSAWLCANIRESRH